VTLGTSLDVVTLGTSLDVVTLGTSFSQVTVGVFLWWWLLQVLVQVLVHLLR
jgi:hypothetical protein